MNFMMNNEKFKPGKIITTFHQSSSIVADKQVVKYITCRIPLLFSLYENRLIHSEFLKEVFTELLENKEILRYNFQNKIFSIYTNNEKLYVLKISLLNRSKIILISTLVILLMRSFPYRLLFKENKNFFRLYGFTALKLAKSPFSLSLLVANKLIRKMKIQYYLLTKKIHFIFFNLSRRLFLRDSKYRNFSKTVILSSQDYTNLFTSLEFIQLLKIYNSFTLFWICLLFKDHFLLTRLFNQFNSKLLQQYEE